MRECWILTGQGCVTGPGRGRPHLVHVSAGSVSWIIPTFTTGRCHRPDEILLCRNYRPRTSPLPSPTLSPLLSPLSHFLLFPSPHIFFPSITHLLFFYYPFSNTSLLHCCMFAHTFVNVKEREKWTDTLVVGMQDTGGTPDVSKTFSSFSANSARWVA